MGGRVLEFRADNVFNAGKNEGFKEGFEEGRKEARKVWQNREKKRQLERKVWQNREKERQLERQRLKMEIDRLRTQLEEMNRSAGLPS